MTDLPLCAKSNKVRYRKIVLSLLGVVLLACVVIRLMVGQRMGWPPGDILTSIWRLLTSGWSEGAVLHTILDIRLLRVALAVVVGGSLALGGVALQALLRNVLAEPFILGLSSGAAVGVLAQLVLSYHLGRVIGSSYIGALCGALLTMGIVYLAGRKRGVIDPIGLLLVGVVLNTMNGALIMVLNQLVGPAGIYQNLTRWMMGYLNESVAGSPALLIFAVVLMVGYLVLYLCASGIDAATFSDAEAMSMGVDLRRLRYILFVIASSLAAGAVVLAGPIAFVGLICPHGARLLLGPRHATLLPGAAFLGAILVLTADTASVCIDAWRGIGLLPIGVFTALIGGPVFVVMLRSHLGRSIS